MEGSAWSASLTGRGAGSGAASQHPFGDGAGFGTGQQPCPAGAPRRVAQAQEEDADAVTGIASAARRTATRTARPLIEFRTLDPRVYIRLPSRAIKMTGSVPRSVPEGRPWGSK